MKHAVSFNNELINVGDSVFQITKDNRNHTVRLLKSTVTNILDDGNIIIEDKDNKTYSINPKSVHTNGKELLKIWIDTIAQTLREVLPSELNSLLQQYEMLGGEIPPELLSYMIRKDIEI